MNACIKTRCLPLVCAHGFAYLLAGIVLAGTIMLSSVCSAAGEQRNIDPDHESIRRSLTETYSRIHAWRVEYESAREGNVGVTGGAYIHRIVSGKWPDKFAHFGTHGSSLYAWSDDPLQQRLIMTPTLAINEWVLERKYVKRVIAPDDPLPGTAPREFIFEAFGWWPFESRPEPKLAGDAIGSILKIASSSKYLVSASQQLVDGHWCYAIEYPKHDRLWIDVQQGCSLIARELFNTESGVIGQRIALRNHREIEPGLFVPMQIKNTLFSEATAESPISAGGQAVKMESIMNVLDLRINDRVPDSDFEFKPQAGSIEVFDSGEFHQVMPGGFEYLDDLSKLINWVSRDHQIAAAANLNTPSSMSGLRIANLVVSALSLAVIAFSWRSNRIRREFNRRTDHVDP